MRFGLYLKGGGAKGAFQAGILCAFWQRGVRYSVVAGTSIGAINGWYVIHNAYPELERLYKNMAPQYQDLTFSGKVIDNSYLMEDLRKVPGTQNHQIEAFYVNYSQVKDGKLKEITEDIKGADSSYALERIRWSSLLPYNYPEMSVDEFRRHAGETDLSLKFKEDLGNHIYDGFQLDGGMTNNALIRNVFHHSGERVIIIGYNGSRDEYLECLKALPVSERERIIYISADEPFGVSDTYNFDPKFLSQRFQEGYEKGINYPLVKLISA